MGLAYAKNKDTDNTNTADAIIGSTFKTLAKAFVVTANIEKLKKDNVDKLKKKNNDKFRAQYAKFYAILENSPSLRARYGLVENMTKDEAVAKIKSLDKKKIYAAIDDIPNKLIADQFRLYLGRKKQEMQNSNMVVQIRQTWERIIKKAYIK
jgi:hypothetical protein